jgi:hypothetical protein
MAPVWHLAPIHRTAEVHAALRGAPITLLRDDGSNAAHVKP